MTGPYLRILIAEKVYLIALDAKAILAGLLPAEITVGALHDLRQMIGDESWDLVLMDTSGDCLTDRNNAEMALAAGAGLVFLTGHSDLAGGIPGFPQWPVVIKPFLDWALLDASLRALDIAGKGAERRHIEC